MFAALHFFLVCTTPASVVIGVLKLCRCFKLGPRASSEFGILIGLISLNFRVLDSVLVFVANTMFYVCATPPAVFN